MTDYCVLNRVIIPLQIDRSRKSNYLEISF